MSRSRNPRRLRLESLENRALLTVAVNPLTHALEITGTNAPDTFSCSQVGDVLTVQEGTGATAVRSGFNVRVQNIIRISATLLGGGDSLTCFDTVQLPVFADGGTEGDYIRGGGVDDNLVGGDGADMLDGGAGNDIADGGDRNDTISGGTGNDTLEGSGGMDRIHGDDGDDWIYGMTEDDFLYGDQGFDTIDGGEDDNDRIWGGTENDTLNGASGNDTVMGEAGNDWLVGGSGNDSLNGGDGKDTLDGGTGRDTVIGGNGTDSLLGGAGNDTVSGDGAGATTPGDDILFGGEGNDVLNGDGGNDTLDGEAGRDTLSGGVGDDTLRGGDGNDSVRGGAGADRAYGGADTDQVYGGAGADQLFGDSGTDTLDGGSQDDILVSIDNDAADKLWGRGGFDSFWVDDEGGAVDNVRDETQNEADTNLHFVDEFANQADGADKVLDGDGIIDPSGGESSHNFAGKPLFSAAGPVYTDIHQGDLGDCWLLASLAAADSVTPNVIRQLVVDLGDGTYAVHTHDRLLNTDEYFRVDTDLPVTLADPTTPQFAHLGAGDSLWVALVEKAWATDKEKDYQNLESPIFNPLSEVGTPFYPLGQIGGTSRNLYRISDGSKVLADIAANGWAGTYCTRLNESDVETLVPSHCYAIIRSGKDKDGDGIPDKVTLYNPHGVDNLLKYNPDGTVMLDAQGNPVRGFLDGTDDGKVTITIDQFVHDAQSPIGALTADFNAFL